MYNMSWGEKITLFPIEANPLVGEAEGLGIKI